MKLTDKQTDNFWRKVKIRGIHACWEWQAGKSSQGYGQFYTDGRMYLAHRVAWALANGRPPKPGMEILHSCDNPGCVNPNHLWEGTHLENMQDMKAKGRKGNRVLTAEKVLAIRAAKGKQRDLAALFGVSYQSIGDIRRKRTWKHLQEEP